jgi:hypothetical protein
MVAYTPNYQIAAGNNNAAGLTAVTSLTDANGVKLVMPRALPFYEVGERIVRANSTAAYRGKPTQDWEFAVLLVTQHTYLRNTFTGLVTVKTDPDGDGTFSNYNAAAWIDERPTGQYVYLQGSVYDGGLVGPGLRGIRLHLLDLDAL